MIRPTILRARGVTILEPFELDLRPLGPLIAIVGENWAGKTSLMECFPGAFYKRFPSRPGHMHDACVGKASLELEFEDGNQRILIKHRINAGTRTESSIFDITNGQPVPLTEGRDAEFRAEVQRRLFSYELFTASNFLASKSKGGFANQAVSKRKQLFAEILRLDQIETANERCASFIKLTIQESEKTRAQIQGITSTVHKNISPGFLVFTEPTDLSTITVLQKLAIHTLDSQADLIRGQIEVISTALERAKLTASATEAEIERLSADETRLIEDSRKVIAKLTEIQTQMAVVHAAEPDSVTKMRARLAGFQKTLAQTDAIKAAQARETVRVEEKTRLQAALTDQETNYSALRRTLETALETIRGEQGQEGVRTAKRAQAALLGKVPCTTAEEWVAADLFVRLADLCPLLSAAKQAEVELGQIPESRIGELDQEIGSLREKLTDIDTAKTEITRQIDALKRARQVDAILLALSNGLAQAESEEKFLTEQINQAMTEYHARIAQERDALEAQITDLSKTLADTNSILDHIAESISYLRASLMLTGIADLQKNLTSLNSLLTRTLQDRQRIQSQLDLTSRAAQDLEQLQAEYDSLTTDQKDWQLLSMATSRNGLQALKIASAGPEVSTIANRLLSACYGNHFDLQFQTLTQTKSGKDREDFDIVVTINGRQTSLDSLCDGEGILVSEGASMAIAQLNAQKNSTRFSILFRDETVGGLSPQNAANYVAMLRRVLQEGIFEKVVFIAHQPSVWCEADSRIFLEDGRITRIE